MHETHGLTMQEAVEKLAYEFKEGRAYIQREGHMTDGPRWKWMGGKLVLFRDMVDGPHPPLRNMYPESLRSSDWIVYSEAPPWGYPNELKGGMTC